MSHFFCPPENIKNSEFFLTAEESRHLIDVLRKKTGDAIAIFDGKGNSYSAQITSIDNKTVRGVILSSLPKEKKNFSIKLFVAIPKRQKLEEIIEKLAQIGVDVIYPVVSERTIVRFSPDDALKKLKRWNTIALAASKQSSRSDILKVSEPLTFEKAVKLAADSGDINIIAWESEEDNLKKVIKSFKNSIDDLIRRSVLPSVNIFIGPEGGYTLSEIEFAKRNDFITVKLGKNILKTDTAAIVLSAIIAYEIG